MNGRECFERWAGEHEWSDWTKPTLFASGFGERLDGPEPEALRASGLSVLDALLARRIAARASDGSRNCVVVDCPGALSIEVGAQLVGQGFAPVVLFNGVSSSAAPLVRNDDVVAALVALAPKIVVQQDPAPAFLLDSRRMDGAPAPLRYDNRWVTFPQDFPSGGRLRVAGVKRCYLLAEPRRVADDLAHVLRRWQDDGIEIYDGAANPPAPLDIKRPLWFKQVFYRWTALSGLAPNAFGGFGAAIPAPSTTRVGYYG